MCSAVDFSSPVPILLRQRASSWGNLPFLELLLRGRLSETQTIWRISPRSSRRTFREHESVFITATFRDFNEWFTGTLKRRKSIEGASSNPFDKIPARCEGVVSVYADYKHFNELFRDDDIPAYGNLSELLGLIPNGTGSDLLGGNGREAHNEGNRSFHGSVHEQLHPKTNETEKFDQNMNQQEDDYDLSEDNTKAKLISLFSSDKLTLWLSSQGAHTPLHYDTYGCNLVVQLSGQKRWRLWPPNSQHHLSLSSPLKSSMNQPCTAPQHLKLTCSRIPYEESSIYSTYDPRSNNPQNNIPPSYDFVVEEGDVLFIPKHYWHFVETDSELSLSVNLWLPVPLPLTEQLICGKYQNDERTSTAGSGEMDGGENVNQDSLVEGKQINIKEGDQDRKGIKIIESDQQVELIVNDTYSRLAEAATRMVFGALKGSVSHCFETDDVRAGWLSPSEKGGTLDFSDFGNLSSSTNNSYPEGMKNIDGEEYKKTLKQSSNDDDSASNSKCDNDDKTINRERFEIETANNNLHLDFLLISLTDLVKEKYETEKSACSGKVDDPEIKIDFEFFLKRFIDAMLQPDVIDSCIAKALS